MKATIEVEAVDALVNGAVEAAMIEALSKNSDKVVLAIVQQVLNDKSGRYGNGQHSIIREALREGIKFRVEGTMLKWLADNSTMLDQMVQAQVELELTPAFVTDCVRDALSGLKSQLSLAKKTGKKGTDEDED